MVVASCTGMCNKRLDNAGNSSLVMQIRLILISNNTLANISVTIRLIIKASEL